MPPPAPVFAMFPARVQLLRVTLAAAPGPAAMVEMPPPAARAVLPDKVHRFNTTVPFRLRMPPPEPPTTASVELLETVQSCSDSRAPVWLKMAPPAPPPTTV